MVARLQANFIKTGGRLDALAQTLVNSPEAWAPEAAKFKTPYEFLISSWRAAGQAPDLSAPQKFVGSLAVMGQRPFSAELAQRLVGRRHRLGFLGRGGQAPGLGRASRAVMAGQGLDPNDTTKSALGARLTPARPRPSAAPRPATKPSPFSSCRRSSNADNSSRRPSAQSSHRPGRRRWAGPVRQLSRQGGLGRRGRRMGAPEAGDHRLPRGHGADCPSLRPSVIPITRVCARP